MSNLSRRWAVRGSAKEWMKGRNPRAAVTIEIQSERALRLYSPHLHHASRAGKQPMPTTQTKVSVAHHDAMT